MCTLAVKIVLLLVLHCCCCLLSASCAKLKDLPSDLSTAVSVNSTAPIEDTVSAVGRNDLELKRVYSPREATYSYFYVGRWLWHIPLWFTLYFTFYVLANVFRSIYGHEVSMILFVMFKFVCNRSRAST